MFSNLHFRSVVSSDYFWIFRNFGYVGDRIIRILDRSVSPQPKSPSESTIAAAVPADTPAILTLRRRPALLERLLGDNFADLHPQIAARFAHSPREEALHFSGSMDVVRRSVAGWLLAQLTRFSGLLPTGHGEKVPFEFNIRPSGLSWMKHRCYHFADGNFDFRSTMQPDAQGRLVERFRGGLGMFLALRAEGDTLHFSDRGYFLHWRQFMLQLPAWCHPGRFELVHRNLDARRFSVRLTLRHVLFGTMIEQSGVFQSSRHKQTDLAGTTERWERTGG